MKISFDVSFILGKIVANEGDKSDGDMSFMKSLHNSTNFVHDSARVIHAIMVEFRESLLSTLLTMDKNAQDLFVCNEVGGNDLSHIRLDGESLKWLHQKVILSIKDNPEVALSHIAEGLATPGHKFAAVQSLALILELDLILNLGNGTLGDIKSSLGVICRPYVPKKDDEWLVKKSVPHFLLNQDGELYLWAMEGINPCPFREGMIEKFLAICDDENCKIACNEARQELSPTWSHSERKGAKGKANGIKEFFNRIVKKLNEKVFT